MLITHFLTHSGSPPLCHTLPVVGWPWLGTWLHFGPVLVHSGRFDRCPILLCGWCAQCWPPGLTGRLMRPPCKGLQGHQPMHYQSRALWRPGDSLGWRQLHRKVISVFPRSLPRSIKWSNPVQASLRKASSKTDEGKGQGLWTAT